MERQKSAAAMWKKNFLIQKYELVNEKCNGLLTLCEKETLLKAKLNTIES